MRARKNRDWVPCQNYGFDMPVTHSGGIQSEILTFALVQQGLPQLQAFDVTNELIEATPYFDEQMTAIRVVGDAFMRFTAVETTTGSDPGQLYVVTRVHVALLDLDAEDVAAIVPDSLLTRDDAEERFVYQQVDAYDVPITQAAEPLLLPYRTRMDYHYDIRTKRRLAPGECLVMSVQWLLNGTFEEAFTQFRPFLRTYVRR